MAKLPDYFSPPYQHPVHIRMLITERKLLRRLIRVQFLSDGADETNGGVVGLEFMLDLICYVHNCSMIPSPQDIYDIF